MRNPRVTFALSALVSLCCLSFAHAQSSPPPASPPITLKIEKAKDARPDYSHESAVIENFDTVYSYNADGTGEKDITAVIALHDQAAVKNNSVIDFAFASSAEHVVITYVRVRHADGTVVETPASDAQEQPAAVTKEAPFYSDLKDEQIPVRSLREGDHLEYKIRLVRTHPEAPGHFWGSDNFFTVLAGVVVLEQSIELHVPASSYVQVWSPKHKPTLSTTDTQKVYRWESSQLTPVAGKDKKDLLRLDPVDAAEEEPRLPAIAWSNFHTWQEVGAWYRSMEGNRIAPDDEIKSRTAEITAGMTTQDAKARAIYGFVGPQVRYIGVAFGVGRYQPHEASEVLSNQYGDCKDKHTLQAAMLAAAGITADAALISAEEPFTADLPSPGWFNHVITLAHVDGKPVWLDATAEVAPYQLLLPVLRGKPALVVPASGDAHLEATPKNPPFPSTEVFNAVGTLDDKGTSNSHMELILRGDSEVAFRQAARSVSPSQWDALMQNISYAMNYSGKVTNAEFSHPQDTTEPFHVTYEYEREKSGDWETLRILPQFPPIQLGAVDEKDLPVTPIEIGYPSVQTAHSVMKIPAGWSAELPPPIHAKSSFATLDKTYKFEDGTVIADRRYEVIREKIPAADWRDYEKWYKDASMEGETYIQLTRAGQSRIQAEYSQDAADLINEAIQLERSRSWDAAKVKLDAAKAINPHQAFLWSNYCYLANMYGKPGEAIDDCKREIADHPAEDAAYRLLASAQLSRHKNSDAEDTLRQLLVQFPGDPSGAEMLSGLLTLDKNDVGAEAVMHTAVTANPKETELKVDYARLLVRNGKKDEAKTVLSDIANTSDNALDLNNSGYELANSSLDVALAEKAIRHSLDIQDDQTTSPGNGDADRTALGRMSLLISTWDSLGWVLYRDGKTAEAESWIRGAWRNGGDMETGYHLALILADQGHTAEALTTLQLAEVARRGDPTVVKLVEDKIAQLKKSGVSPTLKDAKAELQAERTYKVADIDHSPTGWATFDIELTAHGSPTVHRVSGEDLFQKFESELTRLDLKLDIPKDSKAKVIRRGVLSCHNECTFVLMTPPDAFNDAATPAR